MKVAAITLRGGNVVEHEGKLMVVVKNEINQPGKGASVSQLVMRDVRTGNKMEFRFRTQEMVERVRLDQIECTFLFGDDSGYTFMNKTDYEQISVPKDIMGDQAAYLQDGMEVEIESYEGRPLSVTLPDTVTLEVVEAEPVVKGQTASSSYKPAILSNGVKVMVPPFIESGVKIIVRTEDSTYIERAK
ncbi:MAG TPA: elongation factor P [Alphaproteobacteria bacterium]|nr:elongation factor P [Rhodospirillaceae bacterium]HRJ12687.1 elongation factor P [Alphaproteobacteria bacterium]